MSDQTTADVPDWERRLYAALPLFGHRNWIVVADAAYPMQSNPGIETIFAAADSTQVLRTVMDAITASTHIHAKVYLDEELLYVAEQDAPGVTHYREQLNELLHQRSPAQLLHEQIIAKLDESARLFRILVVKTPMTIPYTSVFFELVCGYWSAVSEQRLRAAIQPAHAH
jgi:D-ribose pyranose/furanose isomerase RbsD